MPLIGRQFVRITEFNKLEQRVKKLEDNLGIQTQGRAVDATSMRQHKLTDVSDISRSNPVDEKVSDFINHYKNVQAAEKKLGKGFYANPMRARNKETEGQGFYINSKKKIENSYQTFVRYRARKLCQALKYTIF